MAYTTIKKPSDYFNTKLWSGNSTTSTGITGVGFQPDLVWIKNRTDVNNHALFDVIRSATNYIESDTTDAEATNSEFLQSFDSDGFTLGNAGRVNISGATYVGWNWLASNTTASNTDGSITSTVSANTTSGFSIVSYTGTGANATIGHGLGVAPSMIITKYRDGANNWGVYHKDISAGKYLELNTTIAEASNTAVWNNTDPTSSVFSVGTNNRANSAGAMIAYCFAEVKGFSKFGSYVGNANADGPFIYTGFKPAFVIFKNTSTIQNWNMYDNKRDPYNVMDKRLYPSLSNAEATDVSYYMDFLSNGFKIRTTSGSFNGSGNTIIYMAFAEEPLVGDNPATAR